MIRKLVRECFFPPKSLIVDKLSFHQPTKSDNYNHVISRIMSFFLLLQNSLDNLLVCFSLIAGRCCCKSEECVRAPPLYLYIQMQLCMSSTLKDWLSENIASRQRRYIMGIFSQVKYLCLFLKILCVLDLCFFTPSFLAFFDLLISLGQKGFIILRLKWCRVIPYSPIKLLEFSF